MTAEHAADGTFVITSFWTADRTTGLTSDTVTGADAAPMRAVVHFTVNPQGAVLMTALFGEAGEDDDAKPQHLQIPFTPDDGAAMSEFFTNLRRP